MSTIIEINFADRTENGQRVGWTRWTDDGAEGGVTELRCAGPVVMAGSRLPEREWLELVAAMSGEEGEK
jgi:hypothetical protein